MAVNATTLQRLRLFVLVYERGSFNAAADALNMSQSAVSQHLQTLEAGLGARLFERTPQGARPTAAGEIVYEHAMHILEQVAEMEGAVMRLEAAEGQTLRLGATAGVSVYVLPPILRRFQTAFPKIELSLKTELTAAVVKSLLSGRSDFAFLVGQQPELKDERLSTLLLGEIEYLVVVRGDHPWEALDEISLEGLAAAPFIHRQPSSRTRLWLDGEMARLGVTLNITAEMDSPGVIKYALLSEMGVAILPAYAVAREVARGELVAKRLASGPLRRPLRLLWFRGREFSPVQRAFLRLLGEVYAAVAGVL